MNSVRETVLKKKDLKKYDKEATEYITRKGSGPAHKHPNSEYAVVDSGSMEVKYVENKKVKELWSDKSVLIAEGVPHQLFVDGSVTVYTTKKNLDNLDIREKIEDFIE